MKRFREIIQDNTAPSTSDLWINKGKLKYFDAGWKDLGGSEQVSWDNIQDNPILSNGDGSKVLYDNGTYDTDSLIIDTSEYNNYDSEYPIDAEYASYLKDILINNKKRIYIKIASGDLYSPIFIEKTSNNSRRLWYQELSHNRDSNMLTIYTYSVYIYMDSNPTRSYIKKSFYGSIQVYFYKVGDNNQFKLKRGEAVADTDATETATAQSVATTLNALLASLRASGAIQS